MLKDLTRRAAISAASFACIGGVIFFAFHPFVQYGVALLAALLAAIAIWEYEQFAKAKGGRMILPVLIACTFLEVLSFFAAVHFFDYSFIPVAVFFLAFLALFAVHFNQKEGAVVDLAVSSFGLLYIAVPVGMILGILYSQTGQDGRWWLVYLLIVTKITDIGAYFAGSLWGRRKLAPIISPGKTVEGAIFGLFCALVASFGLHLLGEYTADPRFSIGTMEWLFLGLILGVIAQFGDLSESLLKRDANKKDSNSLPGLGGVLDALDSLLFNAPIVYLYLHYIKP